MRLSWAQTVAGGLTLAVVAGLLLLPGRLLGPDQSVHVAVPLAQAARSVQAAPPLAIRHVHNARPKAPILSAPILSAPAPRLTYVARPRTVVRLRPALKLIKEHRSAVISQLAPTAPLVRARVLSTVSVPHQLVKPASSTAKTIAGLAASLRKK